METLLQKLQNATEKNKRACKYQELLQSFDAETMQFIEERVGLDIRHPQRLSYAALSKVLRSEGRSISASAVANHYSGICACASKKVEMNV